ncbi:hypothetical protein HQ393_04665 [Chitinibacter bivalviorum]|uniref:Uncharacterized protein n=1 Tax=Chitinibacter bivalviorum TaxID=2739434 RepID=A0A7H9BJ72_9NEIS|nr:hypothetical protein [Chitinibacter bivalviorum]QLG87604.1 hypothetical protein HQ393_04665 [Chitinibacter bivalviorum]
MRQFNAGTGVSQAEIDYWLLFIVDQFGALPYRREYYVVAWDVVGKIKRQKESGQWPPPARKNIQFLPMFRAAYGFPG